jgi:hypothetical protein
MIDYATGRPVGNTEDPVSWPPRKVWRSCGDQRETLASNFNDFFMLSRVNFDLFWFAAASEQAGQE